MNSNSDPGPEAGDSLNPIGQPLRSALVALRHARAWAEQLDVELPDIEMVIEKVERLLAGLPR